MGRDLILIDGGAGHLKVGLEVFEELGITDVAVGAIAKGPDRNAGRERLFLPSRPPFRLDSRDPVLYFLQRLRDEAHRFAIGTHRTRRSKQVERSPLDEISGYRWGAEKGLAPPFRLGARGSRCRSGGSRHGGRYQQGHGDADI